MVALHHLAELPHPFVAVVSGRGLHELASLSGLLRPNDDRFVKTVEAVTRNLRLGPTVYRYHFDDGLSGGEGGFHLCTCWLIMAYARMGLVDRAVELLDEFVQSFGPTGMGAEEWDPLTGESPGNVPQAYTHQGLCDVALLLSELGVRRNDSKGPRASFDRGESSL